jgi:hypothetical protein
VDEDDGPARAGVAVADGALGKRDLGHWGGVLAID